MTTQIAYVLISAELATLDPTENAERTRAMADDLAASALPHKQVQGCYAGTIEASFLVICPDASSYMTLAALGRQFGQESILAVDADDNARLDYLASDYSVPVGKMIGVSAATALAEHSEAYTLIPGSDRALVAVAA